MAKAIDIREAIAPLPMLRNRRPDSHGPEVEAAFTTLVETKGGGVFAGSFEGESAWERHCRGDELVQVLEGEAQLTILTDSGPEVLEMKAGTVTVVPQSCWHKFNAPTGVTVMTMTPQPTDHSTAEDPTVES